MTFLQKFLTVFLMSTSSFLSAKDLNIGYLNKNFEATTDIERGIIWVINSDSLFKIDLKSFSIEEKHKFTISGNTVNENNRFIPITVNNNLYVISENNGDTYLWNNNEFIGVDSSYTQNLQRESSIFAHQGKIYKYGGYDSYSFVKNFFTYLENQTNDWIVIHPENSEKQPDGTIKAIIHIINNSIYVFGGRKFSRSGNIIFDDNLYSFELNQMKWNHLGVLNKHLQIGYYTQKEDTLLIFSNRLVSVLDLSNNRFKSFKINLDGFYLVTNPTYFNKNLYLFGVSTSYFNNKQYLILKSIPEKQVYGEFYDMGKIYYSGTNFTYFLVIGLSILLCGILTYIYYKFKKSPYINKLILISNSILYKSHRIEINEVQYQIIQILLNRDEVKTIELYEIIHKDHLHISQLSRILGGYIEDINLKLQLLTDVNLKFINKKNSKIDSRIKVYTIAKEWFEIQ